MREIKFRAWDVMTSKMIPWETIKSVWGAGVLENRYVMQYTGFKDKNGKEIYEGDIIMEDEYRVYPRVVKFDADLGRWMLHGHNPKTKKSYRISIRHQRRKSQVIGNIYENKDLLV